MLPNAEHAPTVGTEQAANLPVSFDVASQFPFPKVGADQRHGSVRRATVPETAIDEDCDPLFPENKIRRAAKATDITREMGTSRWVS